MAMTEEHQGLTFQKGVAFIIAGALGIVLPLIYNISRAPVLCWLLIAVGVYALAQLIVARPKENWWIPLIIGIAYLGIGIWMVAQPHMGWLTFAIAMTCLFAVLGILFILQGFLSRGRCHCWGWLLLAGMISFAAAVLMWPPFTKNHVWIVGLLLGVQLAVYGFALLMMGLPVAHHRRARK